MDIQTRILQPQTIIMIIWSIFSLWTVRATLNNRIKTLEEFKKTIDAIEINEKLARIQTDLDRIKKQREDHGK